MKINVLESKVSGEIELSLQNGQWVVDTKVANYSYGSLHTVFQKVMKDFHFSPNKKSCLILGFGAGSIAQILNKELKLDLQIDGIDLDPVLINLFKTHFDFPNSNCTIYEEDAYRFLTNSNKKYDYIFVDLFQNLDVPEVFLREDFLFLLKKVSEENTQIAMNTMLPSKHPFFTFWFQFFGNSSYKKKFDEANWVVFSLPSIVINSIN